MTKHNNTDERNRAIAAEYRSGDSLAVVGARYGITRERVRQILASMGISKRHGGENGKRVRRIKKELRRKRLDAAADAKRAAKAAKRDARDALVCGMYLDGKRYSDIAKVIGIPALSAAPTISRIARRHNLPYRIEGYAE